MKDKQTKCLFCACGGPFNTREHILPESLGGDETVVMRRRAVCNKCQNYFGSKIESFALNNYPFSHWRVFGGIKTKKGRAPFFEDVEGTFVGDLFDRTSSVIFRPPLLQAIVEGRKTQMRLLAQPHQPTIVCRFLLKMGLEMLHEDGISDVYSSRFSDARKFCRICQPGSRWWFALVRSNDEPDLCGLAISDVGRGDFIFMIYGADITLMCPLVGHIRPGKGEILTDLHIRFFDCLA